MTSAEHIRQCADELGYWSADAAARLRIRQLLRQQHAYLRQAISDALSRSSKPGRPKHPRCTQCGQRMPKETP